MERGVITKCSTPVFPSPVETSFVLLELSQIMNFLISESTAFQIFTVNTYRYIKREVTAV